MAASMERVPLVLLVLVVILAAYFLIGARLGMPGAPDWSAATADVAVPANLPQERALPISLHQPGVLRATDLTVWDYVESGACQPQVYFCGDGLMALVACPDLWPGTDLPHGLILLSWVGMDRYEVVDSARIQDINRILAFYGCTLYGPDSPYHFSLDFVETWR